MVAGVTRERFGEGRGPPLRDYLSPYGYRDGEGDEGCLGAEDGVAAGAGCDTGD